MKVAVLPFNTAEGTRPALGRQFANFVSDTVRTATDADIHAVNYLAQVEEDGVQRAAMVNFGESLVEYEFLKPLFEQVKADKVLDGLLTQNNGRFSLTMRVHDTGVEEPVFKQDYDFAREELFPTLKGLLQATADQIGVELPPTMLADMDFGTDNPEAFLKFIEGYDGFQYVQQSQGQVAKEFDPQSAIDSLTAALELDKEFLAPYETLVQFCRACTHFRIGTFESLAAALVKLTELVPDDFRAWFGLGEIHQAVNDAANASDYYEKAHRIHQQAEPKKPEVEERAEEEEIAAEAEESTGDETEAADEGKAAQEEYERTHANWLAEEAALYSRMGIAQMTSGMPVNAERNFRKALELEDEGKPSLAYLATVLHGTGRAHEVPQLWKDQIDRMPQIEQGHINYAVSLFQAGNEEEGLKVFERALETLENTSLIKRAYAPMLAQKGELDRAMDFFEDAIDEAPNDVELLLGYAHTLQTADRAFEVPPILRNVLSSNPDPNTRAETLAWLIELEQPKRAEAVEAARGKMEAGDFEGAIKDLKPLKNWLADYWKLWALLSAAYNQSGESEEAADAANRLINLYPGMEPAYGELVTALTAQNKIEEAYNVMKYAASNMPNSIGVHLNLALAAKRAGHTDEAHGLARQIREAVGPNEELEPVLAEIER